MIDPLVSVIIPCYNGEKHIYRLLDSIIKQTYKNIELIIINDGSTDKTQDIIFSYRDRFVDKDIRLEYLYQQNKGIGGAIKTGLKLVKGDYFTWCDHDNFYSDDYIYNKVQFFKINPQYSIVRCDGYVVKENNILKPIATFSQDNKEKFKENLFFNALEVKNFHFGCAMLKTSDFDKINPDRDIYESRVGQNWQLLLPMFYHYKSGYIDIPMFYYVYRSDSVSNITSQKGLDKKIAQNNEYLNILVNTLEFMRIPELDKCLNIIFKKYAKINFYLAYQYKDNHILKEQYIKLLKLKFIGIRDIIYYYSSINELLNIILNILKFHVHIYRKIKNWLRNLN